MRPDVRAAAGLPQLERTQRWLQSVIVHPGTIGEALASNEAAAAVSVDRLGELVQPSAFLSPEERVEVYHGMYLLRMVEALESDYPAICHFLGEPGFADLARDYVQVHPSRGYTLNRLGDHLPQFFLDEPRRPNAAFLHDLARAELAITEAFDEEESPTLDVDMLRRVPEAAWPTARLRPIKALRLLSLEHTVLGHLDAAKHDRSAPRPRRRKGHVLVWRHDYSVLRQELTADEHALLAALLAGTALGEAIDAAALRLRASLREKAVFRCFRRWVADGLFAGIEIAPSP